MERKRDWAGRVVVDDFWVTGESGESGSVSWVWVKVVEVRRVGSEGEK